MNFLSIDEIFSENDRIHSELEALLRNVGDAHVSKMVDGEKWTVQQVVEHIAIVDEGASKICHKLLSRARDAGSTASDSLVIGDKFMSGAAEIDQIKVEAPERVRPTGKIRIADSLNRMEDNRRRLCEIKPMFEAYDNAAYTFPYPLLSEMTATEWLIMKGGHEARHTRQIERILDKLR